MKSSVKFGTLTQLLPFIRPYTKQFLIAGIALLIAASAALVIPFSFRYMIDMGFNGQNSMAHINSTFLGLFAVAAILAMATAVRFYMVSQLGERITADMRHAVYEHVIYQSPQFFETTHAGEILSRLTTDTTLIQTLVGTSISMALRNSLLFIGGLIMLFITSVKLSAIILGALILVVFPIVFFAKKVRQLSRASQDEIAKASAIAGEVFNAISLVQAYTQEPYESKRFALAVERAFAVAKARVRSRALLTALAILLIFGVIVFVLWLGAQAVLVGEMTGGELSQFVLYAVIVAGSLGALSEVMGDVQRATGATERLLELLAAENTITDIAHTTHFVNKTAEGIALTLDKVSFHYPSRPNTLALSDLSLHIKAGETVALVGPSGSGKTTLFHLLLRFYDPQVGHIYLDNQSIRDISLRTLRASIGVVPQDTVIFSENAMDNIRYGKAEASDEEVIEAAKLAAAHEFIIKLPEGYHSFLGDKGIRLSGGQRQRIAIARALLKNPPLLLLDEATSALDAESERLVQSALEKAMQHRTTLIIAHRLATVQRADRILVIEHGKIVEEGTHTSLVAQNGLYAKLAALQLDWT